MLEAVLGALDDGVLRALLSHLDERLGVDADREGADLEAMAIALEPIAAERLAKALADHAADEILDVVVGLQAHEVIGREARA